MENRWNTGSNQLKTAIRMLNQKDKQPASKGTQSSTGRASSNSGATSSSTGRDLSNMIQQQYDAAKKAALMENAYGVSTGVSDLKRSYEDALPSYQTSRDQAAIKTQNALDNSALRSALLGDRGGIGQREYGVTQNAGENQQLEINLAQTKQKTDTNRQIADLQAKGQLQAAQIEANNAIERLKAIQQENQRLQSMNQADYQFNKNYALKEADLTGNYQGSRTLSGQNSDRDEDYRQWQKQVQESELTGNYQGTPTIDSQKMNNSQMSDYVKLLIQIATATDDTSILNDIKNVLLNQLKK